ncbi:MAG: D-glycero-beta-D-manno-heptose 1,7-bisphosphate 7-phosphatase [Gammaproteobacteria bacterium]
MFTSDGKRKVTLEPSKFILLDRDGVINEDSDEYIKNPDEWQPIPGSLEAIADLCRAGYRIVVITNQSGLSRGFLKPDTLEAIHEKMHHHVEECGGKIEAVYVCPHAPNDHCECRKPEPGLLKRFASDYRVSLDHIPFIGDSYRDIQAGRAAGANPMLVKTGNGRITLAEHPEIDVPVFEDLYDAARFTLSLQ